MKVFTILLTVLLSLSVAVSGDVPETNGIHSVGVKYKNPQKIEYLKTILSSMNIEFTEEVQKDGTLVLWESASLEQAEEIITRVSLLPSKRTGVKYDDPVREEYLKKVLTAMNLDYAVEAKDDGIWIMWFSDSDEQWDEITNRVSQYFFIKEICKGLPLPAPDQPAKVELEC